jgi:hypothetical protein
LLVVALEDRPKAAVQAWREIRPGLVLDELEPGSFELLPLIYRNLAQCGHNEPELPRLKGIYRKAWVANTLLVERTKMSAEVLTTAGISALFIEGVTLASRFYPELGLRPTAVVDIFVSERHESAALTRLAHAGWAATKDATSAVTGVQYLSDGNGHFCRLRSRLSIDCVGRPLDASDILLADTDEWHSTGGVNVRVPPPTETLFAVIVSNARRDVGPTVQWVVDAKMVLKAEIDWQRLVALADRAGQILRLRDTLEYLTALPGPKPPHAVITRLGGLEVTRRERISYACTTSSIRGVGALPSLFAEHLGATADKSGLSTIATFPSFLRNRWGLTHTWLVPIAAGRRALRLLDPRRKAT